VFGELAILAQFAAGESEKKYFKICVDNRMLEDLIW
jgi:hypothetical protein